ncbi:MAG: hypothetical protein K6T73_01125 [Candidatus Bathyarchaeota archaeon]|nr:hypothetical protein [Candidatus Bathyarchaeota archaeon]
MEPRLTVKEIYNWAERNRVDDLVEHIKLLIASGMVNWEDSDRILWAISKPPTTEPLSENPKKICFCKPMTEDLFDGIVVDDEKAKISPCYMVRDTNLVFTEGIVGALSEEQKKSYCPTIIEIERPGARLRQQRFSTSVKTCKEKTLNLKGPERVTEYLKCVSEEARKR